MATVKLLYRTEKANAKGEAPLYIRITKDRRHRYVSLGLRLHPDHWNEAERRVRKSHRNSQYLNNFLAQKMAEAEKAALLAESEAKGVAVNKIKQRIMGTTSGSFLAYADRYVQQTERNGQYGTAHRVKSIFAKLRKYLDGRDLPFEGVTVSFLKAYEQHLRGNLKNSINTTHANLKVFRRLINEAVREDLLEPAQNPFLKFRLRLEKTSKQYLTEEELQKVEGLELEEGSLKGHHRNMYVFACYAGGLRISDLLLLRWRNFDGERVALGTRKTGSEVSVKLPAKALKIITSYRPGEPEPEAFVFPILSRRDRDYSDPKVLFKALSSENAQANKSLREIATEIELSHGMNFHSSRHTWATRALRKGMRIEYVSKLMGHTSIKTTQIYAKVVSEELDKAMDVFG